MISSRSLSQREHPHSAVFGERGGLGRKHPPFSPESAGCNRKIVPAPILNLRLKLRGLLGEKQSGFLGGGRGGLCAGPQPWPGACPGACPGGPDKVTLPSCLPTARGGAAHVGVTCEGFEVSVPKCKCACHAYWGPALCQAGCWTQRMHFLSQMEPGRSPWLSELGRDPAFLCPLDTKGPSWREGQEAGFGAGQSRAARGFPPAGWGDPLSGVLPETAPWPRSLCWHVRVRTSVVGELNTPEIYLKSFSSTGPERWYLDQASANSSRKSKALESGFKE